MVEAIQKEHPDWTPADGLCADCLHKWRLNRLRTLLTEDRGGASELDEAVLAEMAEGRIVADNLAALEQKRLTAGDRLADRIAAFGGSWTFISIFCCVIVVWMAVNAALLRQEAFDPYPFILLNLVLSCVAAIQAPVILMSQNRQERRDREEALNDYKTNLKAELEIRMLHDKIDHVLLHQLERMLEIQELHTEVLESLRRPD